MEQGGWAVVSKMSSSVVPNDSSNETTVCSIPRLSVRLLAFSIVFLR